MANSVSIDAAPASPEAPTAPSPKGPAAQSLDTASAPHGSSLAHADARQTDVIEPPPSPSPTRHQSSSFASLAPTSTALTDGGAPAVTPAEPLPPPSSPLSSIGSLPCASPAPSESAVTSALSDPGDDDCPIDFDYDNVDGHRTLRLRPTVEQWHDFPGMLALARSRGAEDDGCFKITLPHELREPLPGKKSERVMANAYKPKQIKKNSFWRVNTVSSVGNFASDAPGPQCTSTAVQAIDTLRMLFRKNNNKQIRDVRYRVDVPAWTAHQRREAGVPERSPIHPLKGDKLDGTRAIIPGIHTPYVYESGPHFGASFQIHAEDFRLVSLNHLYKGRKIWIVVPSTAVDVAEDALGRKGKCSQFMRHRAEFFFPQKLDKLGIPFRIVDQRPGETIVILPDAYHEGFSTGYTIAEAKNYGDPNWTTNTYQPCERNCQLVTAIPAELMRPLEDGEDRLDLCAGYEELPPQPLKSLKRRRSTKSQGQAPAPAPAPVQSQRRRSKRAKT